MFSLPNNLLGRELVPELIQDDAVPEKLGAAVENYLKNPEKAQEVITELRQIGAQLRRNANDRAAEAVIGMLQTHAGQA
jgi:lipid-A-disaccharide synthase